MLQIIKNRWAAARDNDSGFTLIELMVVVLIIAILLAIAIPTFLGAQNKSKDRAAQSSARNAHTAARTIYADDVDYDGVTNLTLPTVEPALTYKGAAIESTGPKDVSVSGVAQTFAAAVKSEAGNQCFGIKDVAGTVTYGKWAIAVATPCSGTYAITGASAAGW